MRLNLKILSVLFLLVGTYIGVTLLGNNDPVDKTKELVFGSDVDKPLSSLNLRAYYQEHDEFIYYGTDKNWLDRHNMSSREDLEESTFICPHGADKLHHMNRVDDTATFGYRRYQKTPWTFLQKHYCSWCDHLHDTENYLNALEFTKRRSGLHPDTDTFRGYNTVIGSNEKPWYEANWHEHTYLRHGNLKKDDNETDYQMWKHFCTHDYARVVTCTGVNVEGLTEKCELVGDLCKTYHSPYSGHLERKIDCLRQVPLQEVEIMMNDREQGEELPLVVGKSVYYLNDLKEEDGNYYYEESVSWTFDEISGNILYETENQYENRIAQNPPYVYQPPAIPPASPPASPPAGPPPAKKSKREDN